METVGNAGATYCENEGELETGGNMSITVDDVEALRRVLAELPRNQPKQVSKQETVALLAAELGAAQRRGYKPEDLAQIFSERGIAINAATLRGYLRRNRKSSRRRGSKPAVVASSASKDSAPRAGGEPASVAPLADATGSAQTPAAAVGAREPSGIAGKSPTEVRFPRDAQVPRR
jgi:hypothetical protein